MKGIQLKSVINFCILVIVLSNLLAGVDCFAKGKNTNKQITQQIQVLFTDTVYKVENTDVGLKVRFTRSAGVYYLQAQSEHFESMKIDLKHSRDKKKLVEINADATTLVIKHVLLKVE